MSWLETCFAAMCSALFPLLERGPRSRTQPVGYVRSLDRASLASGFRALPARSLWLVARSTTGTVNYSSPVALALSLRSTALTSQHGQAPPLRYGRTARRPKTAVEWVQASIVDMWTVVWTLVSHHATLSSGLPVGALRGSSGITASSGGRARSWQEGAWAVWTSVGSEEIIGRGGRDGVEASKV
ncbi:uncharacterized protein PSFLO_04954 [Pseudozyma flocculosa]|uniref:Uncharacterized protein n=1 Tax=Pseudozyma flocculosa TaxID=84751 RepID=A0A5C3F4N8_9BASI|nr:uncharacterized protein PSFLO_04954 [Pseudozyma flocculosa]